jgi:putative glutamine amidotransferase
MKPLIGIVPLWDDERDSLWMLPGYMKGIEAAGALPVMLPLSSGRAALKRFAAVFDGFLFTGGHDIFPGLYGEEKTGRCGPVCGERDIMESILFEEGVLALNKSALGICRGIQLFNVLLGGTLYQDIPSELTGALTHVQEPPYDIPAHTVEAEGGTPLYELVQKSVIPVNSYHHQGIKTLSSRLRAMARSGDGLVEAVYMPERRFVWAVQWHPEFSPADETSKAIFGAFVTSCRPNHLRIY